MSVYRGRLNPDQTQTIMRIYFSLLCLGLLAFACEKETASPANVLEEQAEQAGIAVAAILNAQATLQSGYDQTQVSARQEPELGNFREEGPAAPSRDKSLTCPVVTFTTTPEVFWPATLGLTFDACEEEGRLLDGRITAEFNGLLLSTGTDIALTYADFSVNDARLSGNYLVRNTGLDEQGRQSFSSTVENVVFFRNNVNLLTYSHEWNSAQVIGQETNFFNAGLAGIFDDEYDENFTASGTLVGGDAFTIATQSPVRGALACGYKTAGKLAFTFEFLQGTPAILDFGDGSCDNLATVTVGEYVYPIEL